MSGLSRRAATVAATSATLGFALLTSAVPAGADTCLPPALGLPPICVPTAPGVPALPTDPAQLLQTLSSLTPAQLSQLTPQQITDALALAYGLSPSQAAQLLPAVQAALASPDPVGGVAAIATALAGGVPGVGAGSGGAGGPGTGTGAQTPGGPAPGAPAVSRAFRASVTGLKLAANRRSVKVTLQCPATAPGCVVGLAGKVASRSAFKARIVGLAPGHASTTRFTLSKSAARRLRSATGGRLKVTAATVGSSLSPASKTIKAKAKHSRKH